MSKKKKSADKPKPEMRIDPENRVCPQFDSVSIAMYPTAHRGEMGVRVVDDCAFDHIM